MSKMYWYVQVDELLSISYNMVCSAMFLQCVLYTVYCANIMHSRKLAIVITLPSFLANTTNHYLFIYAAIRYATFYYRTISSDFLW